MPHEDNSPCIAARDGFYIETASHALKAKLQDTVRIIKLDASHKLQLTTWSIKYAYLSRRGIGRIYAFAWQIEFGSRAWSDIQCICAMYERLF